MAQERPDRLEAAIDEAARRLTHVETTGFTATRVVARLGERRLTHRRWLVASAAALVLVAAAALTMPRPNRNVPGEARQSTHLRPPALAPSVTPIDAATAEGPRLTAPEMPARSTARPPRVRTGPQTAATGEISSVDAAWRARALPALPEPAPIVIENSQPEALAVPLLELKPIATRPVVLEPIGEGRH
jgi:hypothetical protein